MLCVAIDYRERKYIESRNNHTTIASSESGCIVHMASYKMLMVLINQLSPYMRSNDHQKDAVPAASPAMQPVHFLYNDHHHWLYGWLRFRLGDATDAADLAHDTFVRLIARPRCFDNSQEARAYLRTIANGLCIDLWRHREIERAWLETLATQSETYAPSAEEQITVLQALHEIDSMLHHLPPKAARAFILVMACGMTHQEVARELGVSSRMVRHYITRAMLHCMQLEARDLVQISTSL